MVVNDVSYLLSRCSSITCSTSILNLWINFVWNTAGFNVSTIGRIDVASLRVENVV